MVSWDRSVDFLVVGSGAAGMTAATRAYDLGGETLVIEKAPVFGGSTALSGGVVWVPDNPLMARAGISDSAEEALRYLESVTAGSSTTEKLRAYVETAPRMMTNLAECSHVRFECVESYPDYYPEEVGGKPGGRSCEPAVFDALQLGDEFNRMRLRHLEGYILGGRLTVKVADGKLLMAGGLPVARFMLRGLVSYYANFRARRKRLRNTDLSLGSALVGRLRISLMDRKVPLWLGTALAELITDGGRIVGAIVEKEGKPLRIQAKKGVLLAAGGFERNLEMRERYQQAPVSDRWTAGCDSNSGDTVALAPAIGAGLDLMDDAWWCPAMLVPSPEPVRLVIFEKNLPGGIIVNRRGQRFMNEASPYNDVGKSMYAADASEGLAIPAFLVFDRRFRKKYACGPMMPGSTTPDWALPKEAKGGFFEKSGTLDGLARKIGVDADGLAETVRRFNHFARTGKDPDFGRGDSLQDRYYTSKADGPNPSLAPIETPPFYAVRIYPGDLGTKGGFRTDARSRVLTDAGEVIPGLFAAGNCSAAAMGRSYPGAGGTIGPAMTFGYIAAEQALGQLA
jgi:3-oxosteroid 1-dehydrogenase